MAAFLGTLLQRTRPTTVRTAATRFHMAGPSGFVGPATRTNARGHVTSVAWRAGGRLPVARELTQRPRQHMKPRRKRSLREDGRAPAYVPLRSRGRSAETAACAPAATAGQPLCLPAAVRQRQECPRAAWSPLTPAHSSLRTGPRQGKRNGNQVIRGGVNIRRQNAIRCESRHQQSQS